MTKTYSTNSIYTYTVIALVLVAVAIRCGASFEWFQPSDKPVYSLGDIQGPFPDATTLEKNSNNSLSVFDQNKTLLGYALISDELNAQHQGYADKVPLLIALNTNKKVTGTYLLKHNETQEFIEHIMDKKLLDSWNTMAIDSALVSLHVDVITGATKSSKAIIYTFNKTIGNYLQMEHQKYSISALRVVQLVLLALLLVLSLSMVLKKRFRAYYTYYLVAVFLFFGIWMKKMLSLELFKNGLTKGLPWQSNWELIIILILAIAMAIMGHKKYYCNYLCPMGSLQMLVSKISPFKKRDIRLKISGITLRTIYLSFIWTAIVLGFSLPLAHMEPFMAFSFSAASWFMLSAGGLIIIFSLFFNRPWCKFCPTGCLIQSIPSIQYKHKS